MNPDNDNEKRQELRLSAQETLFIEVDSGEDGAQTQIVISSSVDISANGLQMIIDRPLLAGSIHRLCLQLDVPDAWLYLSAMVIWVRPLADDDGYAVGVQVMESQGTDIQQWKTWVAQRLG